MQPCDPNRLRSQLLTSVGYEDQDERFDSANFIGSAGTQSILDGKPRETQNKVCRAFEKWSEAEENILQAAFEKYANKTKDTAHLTPHTAPKKTRVYAIVATYSEVAELDRNLDEIKDKWVNKLCPNLLGHIVDPLHVPHLQQLSKEPGKTATRIAKLFAEHTFEGKPKGKYYPDKVIACWLRAQSKGAVDVDLTTAAIAFSHPLIEDDVVLEIAAADSSLSNSSRKRSRAQHEGIENVDLISLAESILESGPIEAQTQDKVSAAYGKWSEAEENIVRAAFETYANKTKDTAHLTPYTALEKSKAYAAVAGYPEVAKFGRSAVQIREKWVNKLCPNFLGYIIDPLHILELQKLCKGPDKTQAEIARLFAEHTFEGKPKGAYYSEKVIRSWLSAKSKGAVDIDLTQDAEDRHDGSESRHVYSSLSNSSRKRSRNQHEGIEGGNLSRAMADLVAQAKSLLDSESIEDQTQNKVSAVYGKWSEAEENILEAAFEKYQEDHPKDTAHLTPYTSEKKSFIYSTIAKYPVVANLGRDPGQIRVKWINKLCPNFLGYKVKPLHEPSLQELREQFHKISISNAAVKIARLFAKMDFEGKPEGAYYSDNAIRYWLTTKSEGAVEADLTAGAIEEGESTAFSHPPIEDNEVEEMEDADQGAEDNHHDGLESSIVDLSLSSSNRKRVGDQDEGDVDIDLTAAVIEEGESIAFSHPPIEHDEVAEDNHRDGLESDIPYSFLSNPDGNRQRDQSEEIEDAESLSAMNYLVAHLENILGDEPIEAQTQNKVAPFRKKWTKDEEKILKDAFENYARENPEDTTYSAPYIADKQIRTYKTISKYTVVANLGRDSVQIRDKWLNNLCHNCLGAKVKASHVPFLQELCEGPYKTPAEIARLFAKLSLEDKLEGKYYSGSAIRNWLTAQSKRAVDVDLTTAAIEVRELTAFSHLVRGDAVVLDEVEEMEAADQGGEDNDNEGLESGIVYPPILNSGRKRQRDEDVDLISLAESILESGPIEAQTRNKVRKVFKKWSKAEEKILQAAFDEYQEGHPEDTAHLTPYTATEKARAYAAIANSQEMINLDRSAAQIRDKWVNKLCSNSLGAKVKASHVPLLQELSKGLDKTPAQIARLFAKLRLEDKLEGKYYSGSAIRHWLTAQSKGAVDVDLTTAAIEEGELTAFIHLVRGDAVVLDEVEEMEAADQGGEDNDNEGLESGIVYPPILNSSEDVDLTSHAENILESGPLEAQTQNKVRKAFKKWSEDDENTLREAFETYARRNPKDTAHLTPYTATKKATAYSAIVKYQEVIDLHRSPAQIRGKWVNKLCPNFLGSKVKSSHVPYLQELCEGPHKTATRIAKLFAKLILEDKSEGEYYSKSTISSWLKSKSKGSVDVDLIMDEAEGSEDSDQDAEDNYSEDLESSIDNFLRESGSAGDADLTAPVTGQVDADIQSGNASDEDEEAVDTDLTAPVTEQIDADIQSGNASDEDEEAIDTDLTAPVTGQIEADIQTWFASDEDEEAGDADLTAPVTGQVDAYIQSWYASTEDEESEDADPSDSTIQQAIYETFNEPVASSNDVDMFAGADLEALEEENALAGEDAGWTW